MFNEDEIIVAEFSDEFFAQSFDRPGFNKLLNWVKKNPGKATRFLVTKRSRFSWNAPDPFNNDS